MREARALELRCSARSINVPQSLQTRQILSWTFWSYLTWSQPPCIHSAKASCWLWPLQLSEACAWHPCLQCVKYYPSKQLLYLVALVDFTLLLVTAFKHCVETYNSRLKNILLICFVHSSWCCLCWLCCVVQLKLFPRMALWLYLLIGDFTK